MRVICLLFSLTFTALFSTNIQLQAQCNRGTIGTPNPLLYNTLFVCSDDGLANEVFVRFNYPSAARQVALLVDRNFNFIDTTTNQVIDLEGLPVGRYYLVGLSYAGNFLLRPGQNIYSVPLATGCAQFSYNRLPIQAEGPHAGLITTSDGQSSVQLCLEDNTADFVGFTTQGARNYNGFVYLITDLTGKIETITGAGFFNFQWSGAGTSRIYGLAFNRGLNVSPGDNINAPNLADGCFSLSDNFVTVKRSIVDGGRLSVLGREQFTLDASMSPLLSIDRRSGSSDDIVYVVVDEHSEILALTPGPLVDLTCYDPGKYFIYGYSYTGIVNARVGQKLWSSGVRFATECFIISDNAVVVKKTSQANCQPNCLAEAGLLLTSADTVQISGGSAIIEAISAGNQIIPNGYELVYLLTDATDGTITGIRLDEGVYSISEPGTYGISVLVAEINNRLSPDYFNLATIIFGETTVQELQDFIMDTDLCADLSAPLLFTVEASTQVTCTAFAGGLTALSSPVDLVAGAAILEASPDGSADVPTNFELRYLLTTGFDYVIQAVSDVPVFTVTAADNYTLHAVVLEATDVDSPDYVNLADLQLGISTAFNLFNTAIDAGKCFDLDFFGAQVQVLDNSLCTAQASTSSAIDESVQVRFGNMITIGVIPTNVRSVPIGMEVNYVLTLDGVIQDIGMQTDFTVDVAGTYSIHELVAETTDFSSPDFISLAAFPPGLAQIADITDFLQGSGKCGNLDAPGTAIQVDYLVLPRVQSLQVEQQGQALFLSFAEDTQPMTRVSVCDVSGRQVLAKALPNEHATKIELEVAGLPSGIYIVSTQTLNGIQSKRIFIP